MKKLNSLLFTLLSFLFVIEASAITVNISGTVTDNSNFAPVANHTVYVSSDSTNGFYYFNNVQTSGNGYYSFSIPNVNPNDSIYFYVQTLDCNNQWVTQYVSGNATPLTVNFQICTGSPQFVSISGTVYEAGTTNPVPNHAVTVSADSSGGFFYYTTVYTNSNGYYLVNIQNAPTNTNFVVSTYDCNNNYQYQTVNSNNTPITVNFYICVTPPPPLGTMWGHVFAGNVSADFALISLIRVENDSMTIIEQQYLSDSSGTYVFYNVVQGNYILYAELLSSSIFAGQYIPTYYISSIYWTDATVIQQGGTTDMYDIHLVAAPGYAPGNGGISGNIQTTFKSSNGSPVPNMVVLLLDQNNQPLAYTKTDANGNFSFANIAFGSYTVAPEKYGSNTTPANVMLTSSNPNATTNFLLENGNIFLGLDKKGTSNVINSITISPNPVKDHSLVTIQSSSNGVMTIEIFDMTGKNLYATQINAEKGANRISIEGSIYQSGFYMMKVTDSEGRSLTKKMVVNR